MIINCRGEKTYCCDGCGRPMYSNDAMERIGGPPFVIPYDYQGKEWCWDCLPDKNNPKELDWRNDPRLKQKDIIK